MTPSTRVIVLAAGKGTRMKSELPKVLSPLAGRPLIEYAVASARQLDPERIVLVVGHGAEQVRAACGAGVEYVMQEPQLGTGHAVQQALPHVAGFDGDVVITYGDMPLLAGATLERLRAARRAAGCACTVLTAHRDPPPAFGRVVRDASGRFVRIVEDRDCSAEQRRITEVNIGVYCCQAPALVAALGRLRNDNAQGEYYLTDVLELMVAAGERVETVVVDDIEQTLGVNSAAELAQVESALSRRG
ncbi:MAG: NTP transferase domain-containing protein [Deltaproteobacteria bacterium]|nr:NTP transferase domain-containing protein [Deltaproteobacteria bacterium]